MFTHKFMPAVILGVLVLLVAGCNPGVVIPPAPTLPVSPLPTGAAAETAIVGTPAVLESPLPLPITPAAGKAAATGVLVDAQSNQPMANQTLSLAAVVCPPGVADEDKREQCVYAIDAAFDPSATTDATGRFAFADLTAGEYVIIVGNPEAKHTILSNDADQPEIWKVEADRITNWGELVVDLR